MAEPYFWQLEARGRDGVIHREYTKSADRAAAWVTIPPIPGKDRDGTITFVASPSSTTKTERLLRWLISAHVEKHIAPALKRIRNERARATRRGLVADA